MTNKFGLNSRFIYALIDWNYRNGEKTTRVEIRDKISGRFITGINHLTDNGVAWRFAYEYTGNVVDLRYK